MKGLKIILSLVLSIVVMTKTVQCNEYLDVCTNPKENFEKVIHVEKGQTIDLISFEVVPSYNSSVTFKYILIDNEKDIRKPH